MVRQRSLGDEIKSNSGFPEDGTFYLPSGHSSPMSTSSDVFTVGSYLDNKYPALGSFAPHKIKMEEKINRKEKKDPAFKESCFEARLGGSVG